MDNDNSRKRRQVLPQPEGFLAPKKTHQRVHAPKFQSAFVSSAVSSSTHTGKPPNLSSRPPQPSNHSMISGTRKSVPMRRQPVPKIPSHTDPARATIPLKRHDLPRIPINENAPRLQTTAKSITPTDILMKELPIPVVPTKLFQGRVLPIPDLPLSTDTREMKLLSSSHFAALSEGPCEDDSVDLPSILLQLQEHRDTTDLGRNHRPDILTSPQKNKHVRGGLAARASHLFKKSHTSLYLWRTALEGQPIRQTSPDISFRICQVIHTITTGSYKPCLSITLSRVLIPVRPFYSRKQRVYILVRFPDASKSSPLCNPSILKEGATLHIWRPWHEVALVYPSSQSVDDAPTASLPLPSSNDSTSMILDDIIHNTVVLCSRYAIIQET